MVSLDPRQGGHLGAVQPCGVHHHLGGEDGVPGGHLVPPSGGGDGGDRVVQEEGHPVGHGVLRQGHGVEEGVADPRLRGEEPADAPHLGELGLELRPIQKFQPPAAVGLSLGFQAAEGGQVGFVKGHQDFSGFPKGHVQLLAQGGKALVPRHAELGHQAPGPVVEAGVDHGGVAPAGAGGHVGLLLHQGDGQPVPGQLPGDGAAHGPAADDEYIKGLVCAVQESSPPFTSLS